MDYKLSNIEAVLKEELENHWNTLPVPMKLFSEEFSVDSSSASRTLSNGIDFFIIRALMLGTNNYIQTKLKFEMEKGIRDLNIITSFERILRDLIEIEIVLENIDARAPTLTDNRYNMARIHKANYRIEVYDREAKTWRGKGVFSGATQDQFSLALRLAFAISTIPSSRGARPGFIFLDEPLSGFDAQLRNGFMQLLKEIYHVTSTRLL